MSSSSWPRLLVLEQAGFLPCDPWNGYLGIDPLTVENFYSQRFGIWIEISTLSGWNFQSHFVSFYIQFSWNKKTHEINNVSKKTNRQFRKWIGNWLESFKGPLLALLFRMIGGSTRGFGHLRSCPVGEGRAGWCWLDAWPMGGSSRDVWDGRPEAVF